MTNEYVAIAFLIIIAFICVYAIVNRICKCKEAKHNSELITKMYKEWMASKHPMDDILDKIKKPEK